MPRVFFAVWPDEAAATALHAVAREAQRNSGGRLMRRETLHLTLAFLGEVDAPRLALARRIADGIRMEAFDLVLDQVAYWRHNRILWAGGVSPRLTLLADTLAGELRAAGFRLDARPFAAHVTLLRDAGRAEMPALAQPVAWPVTEFVLAQSRDGRYDIIGRWPAS